jgi:ribonuclease J
LFDFSASFKSARIYPADLVSVAPHSVMLFRPSMVKDLEKADCLTGAHLTYSLWGGYLRREEQKPFLAWLKSRNIPLTHCHTSGHATVADLKRLAKALAPKMLVPIHTFFAQEYPQNFEHVCLKQDGQWWDVTR